MKTFQKFILVLAVFLIGVSTSFARPYIINGPSSCGKGATVTYTLDVGALVTGAQFSVTNSSNTSMISVSGTQYSINVTWSSTASSGTISFGNATTTFVTLNVTLITCTGILTPTSLVNGALCSGTSGSVTLSASAPATNYQVRWYGSGDTFLAIGAVSGTSTYTTPTLSANTSYTVTALLTTNYCESAPVTVTVTMISPQLPAGYAIPVLGLSIDTLHANGADYGSGFTNRWYNASSGGSPLATATKYITPTLTSATTYYVSTYYPGPGCESGRTAVAATIAASVTPTVVTKFTVHTDGITTDTQLYALATSTSSSSQADSTMIYYDGLSRPVQQVNRRASPLSRDVITPIEYDANGRTSKDYLPYVVNHSRTTAGEVFDTNYVTSQASFYTASGDKVADDTIPYATAKYELSPIGRLLEQGAPGKAWQTGSGHSQKVKYSFNTGATSNPEEEVRKFNSDASSTRFYGADTLTRTQLTDANGHLTITYTDAVGHTIAKKQQLDASISGATVNFLETYYVYNDMGQLVFILPPKAVAQLKAEGTPWSITQTFKDTWCFQFTYGYNGRLTQKKSPGQAAAYIAYDTLSRPVLVQTGVLRAANQWQFVKYDVRNRPVMAGLYTDGTHTTLAQIQTLVSGLYIAGNSTFPVGSFFESKGSSIQGYTNISFPQTNADASALVVQNVSYYDNYDFDNNGTKDYVYDSTQAANTKSMWRATGLATGGKSLILGTSNWLTSYVFYDKYGRTIQTRSNNQLSSTIDNLTTIVYDTTTRLVKQTKTYHNAGGSNQVNIIQWPKYDAKGRVTQIYDSIYNSSTHTVKQLVAQYQYNELGQQVTKQLHYNTTTSAFVQTVDLRYNIRGWLTSINNSQLASDGGVTNNDTNDFFGMELTYNTTDPTGLTTTPNYNGNISAVRWKSAGNGNTTANERSYTFNYDKSDQMTSATFQKYGTASWNQEQNTLNESMNYDHNGNVVALTRNQNQRGLSGTTVTSTSSTIDNLSYTYASGNQLSKVDDASANTAGFNDGSSTTTEYTYDTHGNLTADANKGIDSIKYNTLGKASRIKFHDGRLVTYTYDAGGNKLTMASTVSGTTTTTNYVNGFVYNTTGGTNTLNFFSSPEGRVIKNSGGNFEYQYSIADHLGNTRVVFTSATPTPVATLADFDGDANDQESQFSDVPTPISSTAAAHSGSNVVRMNQTTPVGPSLSKQVYPGDKVDMEVYSYYESSSGYGTSNATVTGMITSIAGALIANTGGVDVSGVKSSGVNSALANFGTGANQGDTQPAAFLNYILFDQNYNVVNAGWQVVPSGSFSQQHVTMPTVTVTEPGYIFVYLSYEDQSNNWVYFDDMKVTVTPTQVIQSNEYYPFGLQTAESWTRSGTTNNFLYDQGSEVNTTTGYYDLPYRNYDPALGRFFQIDPLAHRSHNLTPYHYAGNNPIGSNDPSGLLQQIPPMPQTMIMQSGQYSVPWDGLGTSGAPDDMVTDLLNNGAMGDVVTIPALSAAAGSTLNVMNSNGVGGLQITYTPNSDGTTSASVSVIGTDIQLGSSIIAPSSNTMGGGEFMFNSGGTTYGGDYTTTNGSVSSLSYSKLSQSSSGAYFADSPQTIIDYESSPSSGSNWRSSAGSALDLFGALAGAAQGIVVSGDQWLGVNGKYYSTSWGGNQYTGSRAGAFSAAAGYKLAGRAAVAATIVLGGMAVYNGYQKDGGQIGYNTAFAAASATGGVVGGWAGAEGGAAIGAAIGVWFGGIGAVPGAVIGGFIGGIGGGMLGSSIGEGVVNFSSGR